MELRFGSPRGDSFRVTVKPNGNINLTPGLGVHQLGIGVEVAVGADASAAGLLLVLDGALYLDSFGSQWVGALTPIPVVLKDFPSLEMLPLPISDQQLLKLEELRQGGDLQLRLHLRGTLPRSRDFHPVSEPQDRLAIPSSVWAQRLESLGRAVAITVTVPLPFDDGPLRQAAQYLREAKRLITIGEYEPSVIEVRKAMEQIQAIAPWQNPPAGLAAPQRTQAQRWGAIHQALLSQAHGAAHADPITANFRYDREDAIALLTAAAGLLHRAAVHVSP